MSPWSSIVVALSCRLPEDGPTGWDGCWSSSTAESNAGSGTDAFRARSIVWLDGFECRVCRWVWVGVDTATLLPASTLHAEVGND